MASRTTRRGRRRRRRSQREIGEILAAYRASGKSQVAFADSRGVALSSLTYWLRKERESGGSGDQGPTLVPVQIVAPHGAAAWFEVILANDRMIRVPSRFDREALADLVRVVGSSC